MIRHQPDGFLYIITGKQSYYEEACISIKSLKEIHPESEIAVICDSEYNLPDAIRQYLYEIIVQPPQQVPDLMPQIAGWLYKLKHIYRCSPFARTIFMDTDTFVAGPILDLFKILDRFDLCAVPASSDRSMRAALDNASLPRLATINSGVLAFNKSQSVSDLFECALELYHGSPLSFPGGDQHALTVAMGQCPVKFLPLPNTYNARFIYPEVYKDLVLILHGRDSDLSDIAHKVNASLASRIWLPWLRRCLPGVQSSKAMVWLALLSALLPFTKIIKKQKA